MAITSILDFDIMAGKLQCPGYLVVSWIDEQLVWNTSDYSDISSLSLPSENIWTPPFAQLNSLRLDVSLGVGV